MKNGTSFFYISLALIAVSLLSCKLKTEEEDLLDKPGVNITENQVTLIIPKTSNSTKYINIYRRDKQFDEDINIGVIYHPQALGNDGKNYVFIDSLIKKNHAYDYRVRYCTDGEYYYTAWSDKIYIEDNYNAYEESVNLTFRTTSGTDLFDLLYEPTDFTLLINSTIVAPEFPEYTSQNFKPMIIVTNGESTQVFEIPALTQNTKIALRSLLPADFLDTDISFVGIVGQKTIFDDDTNDVLENNDTNHDGKPDEEKLNKIVIWTDPTPLTINPSAEIVNIPSQSGTTGLDYGRRVKQASIA